MSKKMSLYSIKDIAEDDKLFGVDGDGNTTQYNGIVPQTSTTDTTADRLMKVGAFGLGADGIDVSRPDDLDDLKATGFYVTESPGTINQPLSEAARVIHQTWDNSNSYAVQYWTSISTGKTYTRYKKASVWYDWAQVLTTADYPSDSAWTTVTSLSNGWTGTIYYIKRAGMVTIQCGGGLSGASATSNTIFTLPSDYRPDNTSVRERMSRNTADDATTRLSISTVGIVEADYTSVTSGSFIISYPVL